MLKYILTPLTPYKLKFELVSIDLILRQRLEDQKVFISKLGTVISYYGSQLILEDREGPNGNPVGIVLPRLMENRNKIVIKSFVSDMDRKRYVLGVCGALNDLVHKMLSDASIAHKPFLIVYGSMRTII